MNKKNQKKPSKKASEDPHIYLLESIRRISKAIQSTNDINLMMSNILDEVLSIFNCNRAFLVHPCHPSSPYWKIPMERTTPDFHGALAMGVDQKMLPGAAKLFDAVLKSKKPVVFDPKTKIPIAQADQFQIKSQVIMALGAKSDDPWMFGIHQCTHARVWAKDEIQLIEEIGYRITDALNHLLLINDLKEEKNKFSLLIQSAPIVIIYLNEKYEIIEFNKEAENIYGRKRKAVLGKNYLDLFISKKEQKGIIKDIKKVLGGEPTKNYINTIIGAKKNKYYLSWNVNRICDEKNKPIGVIAIGLDITKKKEVEADLKNKIIELQKINKLMIGRELKMVELKEELNKCDKI